jgi:hypothetical protein
LCQDPHIWGRSCLEVRKLAIKQLYSQRQVVRHCRISLLPSLFALAEFANLLEQTHTATVLVESLPGSRYARKTARGTPERALRELCGTHQHTPAKCFSLIRSVSSVPRLDESYHSTQGNTSLHKERHMPSVSFSPTLMCHLLAQLCGIKSSCDVPNHQVNSGIRIRATGSSMSQTRLTFNYTSACNLPLIPHIISSAADYDTARAVTGRGPFRRPLLLCCATC